MKTNTQATNARWEEALVLSIPTFVSKRAGIVRQQKLSAVDLDLLKNARSKDRPRARRPVTFFTFMQRRANCRG